MIESGQAAGTFYSTSTFDNIPKTISFSKVGAHPLYISVGLAENEYMKGWRHEALLLSGLAFLFTLLSGIGYWLIIRVWNRQLEAAGNLEREALQRKQNEARLRAMLDTTAIGMVTIDQHGIIQEFNAACEAIFGYSRQEAIGQSVNMLMPEPDRSAHDSYISNYLATGIGKIIGIGREVNAIRKDGAVFPMEIYVGEVRLETYSAFIGFVNDITARKQAEAEYRTILQTTPDGFWLVSIQNGLLVDVNEAYCAMSGYSRKELLAMR
jgi:PAS domain S-box-containing protein